MYTHLSRYILILFFLNLVINAHFNLISIWWYVYFWLRILQIYVFLPTDLIICGSLFRIILTYWFSEAWSLQLNYIAGSDCVVKIYSFFGIIFVYGRLGCQNIMGLPLCADYVMNIHRFKSTIVSYVQINYPTAGAALKTWFNFNPGMDKY